MWTCIRISWAGRDPRGSPSLTRKWMAHAGIKCTTLMLLASSKLRYSQLKWCMSNPSCNMPSEYGFMTNFWRKAVHFLGEQKIIASINVFTFHTHSGKNIICIFFIKLYRKIYTELYLPLLYYYLIPVYLPIFSSFTMLQYHVINYSNALSLSFKSLYHWQNQFQALCAFLSSCSPICISMESL